MIEIYEIYKHNIAIICPHKNIINIIIALNNIINNKDGHLSILKKCFIYFVIKPPKYFNICLLCLTKT